MFFKKHVPQKARRVAKSMTQNNIEKIKLICFYCFCNLTPNVLKMSQVGVTDGLHGHIYATIDHTWSDDIEFQLMNTLECPMILGVTDNMIISNSQFYNKKPLNHHWRSEKQRNLAFLISRYTMTETDVNNPNNKHCLKDPRTGQNLDCTTSLRSLLVSPPYREDFVYLITDRVIGITEEEAVEFLPEGDNSSEGQNNIKV